MVRVSIINIAAYKFVSVPDPEAWVPLLKERCVQLALKGTIVLAQEGINLFLAGSRDSIDSFLSYLRGDVLFEARFAELDVKESVSENQPFRKMVVRVAKEIITMRHPTIRPADARASAVEPATLRQWLDQGHDDQGRAIVLLDTRNAFEVEIGTFKNAKSFDIEKFSQFPDVIRELAEDASAPLANKTVVSFCTGGIRCEKAALYMQDIGLANVFQLQGGILRYFEEVGGAHWQGECFVFDERVALDPQLQPTTNEYVRNQER
ncbi:MAG: sulfurtransferase [Candidatus Obscuribacterales bacterium]|nr:sulfurtransferase [Candidatus Obscuribacterales bacterium]